MEPLNYPIIDGMVGSCVNSPDAKETCQLFSQVRFKLSASVHCEGGWNVKTRDPARNKGLGYGFSCYVRKRNDFRTVCESINASKHIMEVVDL